MRIALGIEYDGADFYGWQRQRDVSSVQQHVEQALGKVADHAIEVQCAGRTDAGVHATGQVIHFDTQVSRPERAWTLGLNANLPGSIAVKWAKPIDDDFHARFSATARRYRYIIYNNRLRSGILPRGVTHVYAPLNEADMFDASQCLLGEHDFSAFRAAICQSRSPFRNITALNVYRRGEYVILDIQANAFVHHMVRNIAGSLIDIGAGRQSKDWLKAVLQSRDRTQAAATAKPNGLYLVAVTYPPHFELPKTPPGPLFL